MEKKGGKRDGAGRPTKKGVTVYANINSSTYEELKKIAERDSISLRDVINDFLEKSLKAERQNLNLYKLVYSNVDLIKEHKPELFIYLSDKELESFEDKKIIKIKVNNIEFEYIFIDKL